MKKFFLAPLFLLILVPTVSNGAAFVSNGTGGGLWSAAGGTSWDSPPNIPGAGDTITILVGDTITLDGNISVGNNAVNDTTYNIDIAGNLVWPSAPGASWTFSPSSTILLNGTGKFYIGCSPGSPTDRLDCDYTAIVDFQTGGGIKYDIRIDGASAQLFARGCVGYHASTGTETRARITACAPDCNAGAARVLTLDTTVNWVTGPTITNPVTGGDAEVVIGAGGNIVVPGGWNSELAVVTDTPATNQVEVTLVNNHQIGDMVVNPTKNILFRSSSAADHGSLYSVLASVGSPWGLSWVRLDEMGDGLAVNTAALGADALSTTPMGSIDYTWITNCEDVLGVHCFYIEGDFTSFDYNGAYDSGTSGNGLNINVWTFNKTITGFTAIRTGANSTGRGVSTSTTYPNSHWDKLWASDGGYCFHGGAQSITDSLCHHMKSNGIVLNEGYSFEKRKLFLFEGNELRNMVAATNSCLQIASQNVQIVNNDFDNCCRYGILSSGQASSYNDFYSTDNTFDGCNWCDNASDTYGAIYWVQYNGDFYSQNDDFGSTVLNNRNNLAFQNCQIDSCAASDTHRVIINDPILNGPNNPTWAYPIIINQWGTDWRDRFSYGPNSFATVHNEDQVAGSHWGVGPGGMFIERVTGAGPVGGWVDNTVNMKVIPFAADRYCRVRLGKILVGSGDVLTVNLQIQKNQAATTGRRPRLALKGSGFDLLTDYDEMADVNNTWDAVSVSGTATADGGVHLYLEVLNDLEPAPGAAYVGIEPLDPPTIVIYVDGFAWSIL